ncbi:uncharacterized protein TRIVIDRAFT_62918 [Trichoderma virens Gv29-8]|uniref:GST N-terminal domain-containing protein n=1 Tax=Hypocrea virens (strain Gv29-8 / FGSC 10586) TaxID=413071 RepID=G9MFH8_HYPVG|nr:uncharacterized protein TRIVIDRAFT_62918 [Trichoderma virens Gv29-8]EHK27144.1 hypothetical protein TRIVIDRAFT_62918 [Trichoderma virens Gv29-8]
MAAGEIILYHYKFSPYARRVVWYLALRGIPYKQCLQPGMLPRPDVARLGIAYRRIPILSIGKDIYLDTRLQLPKLEAMYPELPRLGASTADQKGIERLLSAFVIDGGVFQQSVKLLPPELPFLKDPKYFKDRGDYMGTTMSVEALKKVRPEALREVAAAFELLETTMLADGREWILKTEKPSLADIESVWVFHWISGIPGALPKEGFSADKYPRVYSWIKRFQEAVTAAKKRVEESQTLDGEEAAKVIEVSSWHEEEGTVDEQDALAVAEGLRKGVMVVISPTDTGRAHKDVGRLVSLDKDEVVIEVKTEKGESVRLHAPRHGYKLRRFDGEAKGGARL